jgi:hypothetical protein
VPDVIRRNEFVVIPESQEELLHFFRERGVDAYVYRLPFGMKLPKDWNNRPSEAISVGGSVSVEFAVPALLLAHKLCPHLKYMHLATDTEDHFTTPESLDYEIVLNFPTEAVEKFECKPWSDGDFAKLKELDRQADFHYYLRSFYKKNVMILRDEDATLIKYIGGIHDGQTMRMQGTAEAILQLDFGLGRVPRQDGTGFDLYEPRLNGRVVEYRFVRTERPK